MIGMIAGIGNHKKRILFIVCVICSLLIHLVLLKVRIYQHTFFLPFLSSQNQPAINQPATRPIMLTHQIPDHIKRAYQRLKAINTTQQTPPTIPLPAPEQPPVPQQPAEPPQPQETPSGHKIFRAGTGFDAPMTEKALAPAPQPHAKHHPQKPAPEATEQSKQQASSNQAKTPPDQFTQTEPEQVMARIAPPFEHHTPMSAQQRTTPAQQETVTTKATQTNRLSMSTFDKNHVLAEDGVLPLSPESAAFAQAALAQTAFDAHLRKTGEQAALHGTHKHTSGTRTTGSPATRQRDRGPGLNFLAQENFEHIIREHMYEGDGNSSGTADDDDYASTYGASNVQRQYGDQRFLHYNRKIYQALQQSMDLVMRTLSMAQYQAAMDGVRAPTRINFSLDQNGQLVTVSVARSSGNIRYDNLAQKIIRDAAYPSIPKSFELRTTYHHYGILLFDPGPGARDTIGVSPYLEGE
jgi:TonB family protein